MSTHIERLNSIRRALIAAWKRAGGYDEKLQEAIDSIGNAIQSLGGEVAEVEGY